MTENPGGSSIFFLSVGYGKGSLPKSLLETYGILLECLSFYVETRKVKVVKKTNRHYVYRHCLTYDPAWITMGPDSGSRGKTGIFEIMAPDKI
jgi:hypothetical protein